MAGIETFGGHEMRVGEEEHWVDGALYAVSDVVECSCDNFKKRISSTNVVTSSYTNCKTRVDDERLLRIEHALEVVNEYITAQAKK